MNDRTPWLPAFETGIPDIDHDHRQIFDLVTELQAAAEANDAGLCRSLASVVMDRAEEHFAMEEWFLRANDFPRRDIHSRYHRQLSRHGRTLAAQVNRADTPEALRLHCKAFLALIIDDIIKGDMDFKSHVQERQDVRPVFQG